MPRMETTTDSQGYNLVHYALQCVTDPEHQTYVSKHKDTRFLTGREGQQVEVNLSTGQEVGTGTAIEIVDHASALARVNQASSFGMFPASRNTPVTPEQLEALAIVTLAYELDPMMGELIPYQGKPYVTIAGRRRKDADAGHHGRIRFRPLTQDETAWFKGVEALKDGDLAMYCIITDVESGAEVEAFARVLAKERMQTSDHLPVVNYDIEMCQKRAERRAREMIWGPISKPKNVDVPLVMVEGDEVIEAEGRIIEENEDRGDSSVGRQTPATKPVADDLGNCPEHDEPWIARPDTHRQGMFFYSHRLGQDDFCKLNQVYGSLLPDLWERRHGEYVKKDVDAWLKETFGATWSKMAPADMVRATQLLAVDQATGELPDEEDADDLPEGGAGADDTESESGQQEMLDTGGAVEH